MLLRKLRLVNYGGIYNGMGLYDICIDFTKCKHRTILIKGDNGSGKSTIEGALKPLPDDNTSFIAGKTAMKEIEYFDEFNNIIYSIQYIHEAKPNGSRATAKGYIQKVILNTGNRSELNPSGSIQSCKDIIYEEFQLDPNYMALIQLSNSKRGLADLRPAERKRFTTAILSNTEAYNDIHKKLSSKSTTYKGLMQNITAKLNNIGDIGKLQAEYNAADTVIKKMTEEYNTAMRERGAAEGSIRELDPDGKIVESINYNKNKITALKNEIEVICNKTIKNLVEKTKVSENQIRDLFKTDTDKIEKIEEEFIKTKESDISIEKSKISSLESKIELLLQSREVDASELQAKTAKLQALNSDDNLNTLRSMKEEYENRIKEIEDRWNGFVNPNDMSRSEFIIIVDIIATIREETYNIIREYREILDKYLENGYNDDINANIKSLSDSINDMKEFCHRLEENINMISNLQGVFDDLSSSRPEECTIDTCPFIKSAMDAKNKLERICDGSSPSSAIADIKTKIYDTERAIKDREFQLESLNGLKSVMEYIDNVIKTIGQNRPIFSKIPMFANCVPENSKDLQKFTAFVNTILDDETLRKIYGYIDYANDLEEYSSIVKNLEVTKTKLESLDSQADFIDLLTKDIKNINDKIDSTNEDIETYRVLNDSARKDIEIMENELTIFKTISDLKNIYTKYAGEIDQHYKNLESLAKADKKIGEYNKIIERNNKIIENHDREMQPYLATRERCTYYINLISQYNTELAKFKDQYDKIETLKHFSSPTTGIQLVFASLYLNNIINNANKLLQNLFGGVFTLLPFVITENEFRIPVAVCNGFSHDDITSMSSAQVSLISMIISISLLSQTSTKLNIIVADEIDAPFDSTNRREFLDILETLMNLVKSSQCVLISHNSEIPMDECDVILLKSTDYTSTNGNIIWSYYNEANC